MNWVNFFNGAVRGAFFARAACPLDTWQALSHDYLPLATDAYRETPDPTAD